MEHKTKIKNLVVHIILIIFSLIMLVPFAWMILTALKTNQEAISVNPFYILPHNGWHWENFATVWKSYNFIILYKNTLLLIFFRVVCACLTATMAGYAFGRLKFPGKTFMFTLVLVQMMIPSQIFIIPQYLMVSKMGMLNTTFGLVFPGLVTAFGTYLLKTGYEGLPRDLDHNSFRRSCQDAGSVRKRVSYNDGSCYAGNPAYGYHLYYLPETVRGRYRNFRWKAVIDSCSIKGGRQVLPPFFRSRSSEHRNEKDYWNSCL